MAKARNRSPADRMSGLAPSGVPCAVPEDADDSPLLRDRVTSTYSDAQALHARYQLLTAQKTVLEVALITLHLSSGHHQGTRFGS